MYENRQGVQVVRVNDHENLYSDVLSMVKQLEHLILWLEYLLLWKNKQKSIAFYIFVHLLFWGMALSPFNSLFLLSFAVLIYMIAEIFDRKLHIFRVFHFNEPEFQPLFSTEELSRLITKCIVHLFSFLNKAHPFRKRRPLLFFLSSLLTGAFFLWVSRYFSGLSLVYLIINIVLFIPAVLYNGLHTKCRDFIMPFVKRLEAEFDKKQLESPEQREAEEAEFWSNVTHKGKRVIDGPVDETWPDNWVSSNKTHSDSENDASSSIDGDHSESKFFKNFLPEGWKEVSFFDTGKDLTVASLAEGLVNRDETANESLACAINELVYGTTRNDNNRQPLQQRISDDDTDEEIIGMCDDEDIVMDDTESIVLVSRRKQNRLQ